MQKAAIYIRVSTDDQLEFSPGAQKHALLEYAKKNNYTVENEFIFIDEGISGRTAEKRPAFMNMIGAAKTRPRPFEIILVHKFDRFARNREDSVVYKSLLRKECGIKVISISEHLEEDKFSIILEAMLEAMAEYYSLNLSDEVKKGMFEKARRGEHIGKAPFGYVLKNKKLYPHEFEFKILQEIYNLYVNEDKTISQIVSQLNDMNIKTKYGGKWRTKTLSYIIENPVNSGMTRYNYIKKGNKSPSPKEDWIIADSNHESAISKEIFAQAIKKRENEKISRRKNYNPNNFVSWAQKILRCCECGGCLTVSSSKSGKYKSFRCSKANQGLCNARKTISANILEKIISEEIKKDSNQYNFHYEINSNKKDIYNQTHLLLNSLKEIDGKLELIKQAYLNKIDSIEEYEENKKQLLSEKKNIEKKLHAEKDNPIASQRNKVFNNFYEVLEDLEISLSEKNRIAKSFIKEITVNLIDKKIQIIHYS